MSFNTFGKIFRFTTWGESHGPAIGCIIDGCPPNIEIKSEYIQKEGDGGGGFGDGGGTAFTSTDAGIFTPTHSERGRKPKKEKRTGVHRLADFLTDNSPERKMAKGDSITTTVVNLINWVKMEMRHEDELKKGHFRQQTSGETINRQPPRICWYNDTENKEIPNEDNPVEFEAEPDEQAATSQKDEERRIRRLQENEDKKDNEPQGTGTASMAAPAGLNISLSEWDPKRVPQTTPKRAPQGGVINRNNW